MDASTIASICSQVLSTNRIHYYRGRMGGWSLKGVYARLRGLWRYPSPVSAARHAMGSLFVGLMQHARPLGLMRGRQCRWSTSFRSDSMVRIMELRRHLTHFLIAGMHRPQPSDTFRASIARRLRERAQQVSCRRNLPFGMPQDADQNSIRSLAMSTWPEKCFFTSSPQGA